MVYAYAGMLLYIDAVSRDLHARGLLPEPARDYGAVIAALDDASHLVNA